MGYGFGDGWSADGRWNRLVLRDGKPTGWLQRTAGNSYDGTLIGQRLLEALDSGKEMSLLAAEFGEGRLVPIEPRHKLGNGWYDDGYFWRSIRRDGRPIGWLWREGGRGSSAQADRANMMIAAADAGMPLAELVAQTKEMVPSDGRRRPVANSVVRDARTLSGGTMATLIREMAVPNVQSSKYEVIDRVRTAFVKHIGSCATKYDSWQTAWHAFRITPKAIETVAGGPVHAEGVRCEYELHYWDRPKAVFDSLSDLDAAFRKAVTEAPVGDKGQLEAVVYRRQGERGGIARTHGHRLSSGFAEVRPLLGWEQAEMAPLVLAKATKEGKTFAEIFDGSRVSLMMMAESWHKCRGKTPVEFLRLFASLNQDEEVQVIKNLRAVVPMDGEPFDCLVSRRANSIQESLDKIQETRGLPPIVPGPPPGGYPVGQPYTLTDGDKMECQRIAMTVARFFGKSNPAVIVRVESDGLSDRRIPDGGGWHWVKICDMDGRPLRMGSAGVFAGEVQCGSREEAEAMASALRDAIDEKLAPAVNLRVQLSNCGNPDHGENPECPVPGKPAGTWVDVADLAEASGVCRRYIKQHDLGGGNWSGGTVADQDGTPVGRISYNGRVWAPGPWKSGDPPLYDPFAEMPASANAPRPQAEGGLRLDVGTALADAAKAEDAARQQNAAAQPELPLSSPTGPRR